MSAPPFSFGFQNEDIDDTADEANTDATMGGEQSNLQLDVHALPVATDSEPRCHTIDAMCVMNTVDAPSLALSRDTRLRKQRLTWRIIQLKRLPSRISYSSVRIPSREGGLISHSPFKVPSNDEILVYLPRREYFDIKVQQMAEEQDCIDAPVGKAAGLSTSDIIPNSYEGGFKTWECSVDLATYLAASLMKRNVIEGEHHIVEVGAGSALPTLTWLYYLLKYSPPTWTAIQLSIADFNQTVLELSTTPNLLLTWHFARSEVAPPLEGDLEITLDLLNRFTSDLSEYRINISFLSGSWGPKFHYCLKNIIEPPRWPGIQTMILASETIYSPTSIRTFTEVLVSALETADSHGGCAKAFVAAKQIYFGVGGGVDEFVECVSKLGCEVEEVWKRQPPGVATVILDIVRKESLGAGLTRNLSGNTVISIATTIHHDVDYE